MLPRDIGLCPFTQAQRLPRAKMYLCEPFAELISPARSA